MGFAQASAPSGPLGMRDMDICHPKYRRRCHGRDHHFFVLTFQPGGELPIRMILTLRAVLGASTHAASESRVSRREVKYSDE